MAEKKPKKKYSLYRQGVKDAIDTVTNTMLNDIYAGDPYARKEDIHEKVLYIQKKLKDLIK